MTSLNILSSVANGRTQYEPITTSGSYEITLDNTVNYVFNIGFNKSNIGVSMSLITLPNGITEVQTFAEQGYAIVLKKDKAVFSVSNATATNTVKIESYIHQ